VWHLNGRGLIAHYTCRSTAACTPGTTPQEAPASQNAGNSHILHSWQKQNHDGCTPGAPGTDRNLCGTSSCNATRNVSWRVSEIDGAPDKGVKSQQRDQHRYACGQVDTNAGYCGTYARRGVALVCSYANHCSNNILHHCRVLHTVKASKGCDRKECKRPGHQHSHKGAATRSGEALELPVLISENQIVHTTRLKAVSRDTKITGRVLCTLQPEPKAHCGAESHAAKKVWQNTATKR
jgi:hypothetical protein